jgi:adenosine deaminase
VTRAWVVALTALVSLALAPAALADPASEAAAAAQFDALVASPTKLRIFLKAMPKGGDLHNHLSGGIYAEDYLKWAGAAGYCVDDSGTALVPPPCPTASRVETLGGRDPFAFARLVDALSTRGLQQGVGRNTVSGHGQFFATFERFGPVAAGEAAKSLAAMRQLAAGDRVGYVELMHNPGALNRATLAAPDGPIDPSGLDALYQRESAAIGPIVMQAMAELDRDEAEARRLLGCGGAAADPACGVAVHYLTWAWRDVPPAQAFRSLLLGFALADRDPRYVGINIVQPEDWPIALRDYDLHMAMFRFLEAKYPKVHRTIHAGELAFGLVPPRDLRDHIRKAIDAGAERIGHGTDIALEDDARATLARMARDGIAVEINLTSNDVILGVKGDHHPLQLYRSMGVPVTLSTDDEGVLRTDMTNEYVRAAREQGLRYADLKGVTRASLEYAFIPGASLWRDRQIGTPVAACRAIADPACARFAETSEKARLQRDLERRLDRFEQEVASGAFRMQASLQPDTAGRDKSS